MIYYILITPVLAIIVFFGLTYCVGVINAILAILSSVFMAWGLLHNSVESCRKYQTVILWLIAAIFFSILITRQLNNG